MSSKRQHKNSKNIKDTKNTKKESSQKQNAKIIVVYIALAVVLCAIFVLLAFKFNKEEPVDPSVLVLEGEWKDIMTESTLKFEGENFYLDTEGPYRYEYNSEKQVINIEYRGGDPIIIKCNYIDGYWKLTWTEAGQSFAYVTTSIRDELRNQAIAEKWAVHTQNRVEVVLGQEYTTADGIKFTITSGEVRNTPDVVGATAIINLNIDCSVDINATNWVQSEVKTPEKRSYGNTEFDSGADVTFCMNITGVTELGKEPYDYCIMQFKFGGTDYYLDLLTLNLIAE